MGPVAPFIPALIGAAGSVAAGAFGGVGGGSSSQGPVETTPTPFRNLQQPIADVIRSLFEGGAPTFGGVQDPSRFTAGMAGTEGSILQSLMGMFGGGGAGGTFQNKFGQTVTSSPEDLFARLMNPQEAGAGGAAGSMGGAGPAPGTGAAGGMDPSLTSTNAAQGLLQQTLQGQFLSPESNPFLAAQIQSAQRPLIQQYQDVTMPRLQGNFTAAGQRTQPEGSSAFDRSAALATRGLFDSLGDISAKMTGQNFQAERARQVEAVTQSSQLRGQEVQNTIQSLQAAALPRLIEQFGIDRGLEEFNSRMNVILQAIQLAQGLPLFAQGQTGTQQTNANIAPLFNAIGDTLENIDFPAKAPGSS